MKAVGKKIIIQINKDEFKQENGLIKHISDRPITEGVIVSIGQNYQGDLKEGDKVTFREHPGEEVEVNSKHFYIVNESAIYGTINE
jgi:co-chaperonin GroES (HSP10)